MARHRILTTLLPAAVAGTLSIAAAAAAAKPADGVGGADVVEQVDVTIVQVDVSVLDPKSNSRGSVRGLAAADFDVRIDGKKLTEAQRATLAVDEMCSADDAALRPVIVAVDFNYVDAAGRGRVADALERIADAPIPGLAYKFYGLTREVRALTSDFVTEPDTIRRIAGLVRETAYVGDQTLPVPGVLPSQAVATARSLLPQGGAGGGSTGDLNLLSEAALAVETYLAENADGGLGLYQAEATLGAMEGLLRAHDGIPGRKVVVLFTTPAFRGNRRPDLMQARMEPLRQLSQQGFSVWTVDTTGVAGGVSDAQSYFGMLAKETGGETVRHAADLTSAFQDAAEQLSCYYLISLPVPRGSEARTVSRLLTVALDTKRRPDLWNYTVRSPYRITMLNRAERIRRERVAALLEPADFTSPRVTATLGFPVLEGKKEVLPVRFRVPLSDLTWLPEPEGGYAARLLFDATVHRDNGQGLDTLCAFDAKSTGTLTVKLPQIPADDARAGLAIRLDCPVGKDGLHTARGVVTDLGAGAVGAGRGTVVFRRGGSPSWIASALRVEAASGLDYVWRPGSTVARRDADRTAGRLVGPDAPADAGDHLYFQYVLCGPERAQLRSVVRHAVLTREADGTEQIVIEFPPEKVATTPAPGATTGPFCTVVRLQLRENTLGPGRYVFAVTRGAPEGGGRGPRAGADAGAGTGAGADAGADVSARAGADAGADAGARAGADAGADAGAGAGAGERLGEVSFTIR